MNIKPDILDIVRKEGIELHRRGIRFWTTCPFHTEINPSFKIDPVRQNFYCFGCGAHGDVIAFIQKYRCLSFTDTLNYLGIKRGKLDKAMLKKIKHEKKKLAAITAFRQWCNEYYNELADLYRKLQQAKDRCKTWADVERIAPFYHDETHWQLSMDILAGRDDQAKFDLYREVTRHAA